MASAIAAVIFVLGYLAISFEYFLRVNKAAIGLLLGGLLWLIIALTQPREAAQHALADTATEIFSIVVFLLAAMTLVEILVHYRFFDLIRARLFALHVSDRAQFWIIGALAFALSPIIDNLTATLAVSQLSRRFFRGSNLLLALASIVVAANAGGAFSPIGDVTTLMLWLAGKFPASTVIVQLFLPSLVLFVVSGWFLSRRLKADSLDIEDDPPVPLSASEQAVVTLAIASFLLPFGFSQVGLPPYLGILTGLAAVWIASELFRNGASRESHLAADIGRLLQKTDIATLNFFVGILLAVAALQHLGVLATVSRSIYGEAPSVARFVAGNVTLGVLSAFVDNVPLTAIAIDILHTESAAIWSLLALTVGTGGSLLVIGSAAGIVAMGVAPDLTFFRYLRIATVPALLGYVAAIGTWLLQYRLFG